MYCLPNMNEIWSWVRRGPGPGHIPTGPGPARTPGPGPGPWPGPGPGHRTRFLSSYHIVLISYYDISIILYQ